MIAQVRLHYLDREMVYVLTMTQIRRGYPNGDTSIDERFDEPSANKAAGARNQNSIGLVHGLPLAFSSSRMRSALCRR